MRQLRDTQIAIKEIKDYFENKLAKELNLIRVSAPLFVRPESGLNDNLTGKEKAVSFKMRKYDENLEIVQSLAKWKRLALKWYKFDLYEGIYTDMDAIRPDEVLDATHSIYVDQWDWEKVINKEDRNFDYLEKTVKSIFKVFKETEKYLDSLYPGKWMQKLPEEIKFISTQELEDMYPDVEPEERENLAVEKYKAIFVHQIGKVLKSGDKHDFRAPDYDDWELNGDIIFWDPILQSGLELSSMGIRVDEDRLDKQLTMAGADGRRGLLYHQELLSGKLPYTIGGGIGQSRMCMFFLDKKHIGEVQASVWTDDVLEYSEKENIFLL